MYKVIVGFKDLRDGNYAYKAGDVFPRDDKKVSDERLTELSSINNKRHTKLIEEIRAEPKKTMPKKSPKPKAEDKTSAE